MGGFRGCTASSHLHECFGEELLDERLEHRKQTCLVAHHTGAARNPAKTRCLHRQFTQPVAVTLGNACTIRNTKSSEKMLPCSVGEGATLRSCPTVWNIPWCPIPTERCVSTRQPLSVSRNRGIYGGNVERTPRNLSWRRGQRVPAW